MAVVPCPAAGRHGSSTAAAAARCLPAVHAGDQGQQARPLPPPLPAAGTSPAGPCSLTLPPTGWLVPRPAAGAGADAAAAANSAAAVAAPHSAAAAALAVATAPWWAAAYSACPGRRAAFRAGSGSRPAAARESLGCRPGACGGAGALAAGGTAAGLRLRDARPCFRPSGRAGDSSGARPNSGGVRGGIGGSGGSRLQGSTITGSTSQLNSQHLSVMCDMHKGRHEIGH